VVGWGREQQSQGDCGGGERAGLAGVVMAGRSCVVWRGVWGVRVGWCVSGMLFG